MSQFYKIIFPGTIEAKKLRIPEQFVTNYGNKISDPATLLLSDGRLWVLGITKDNKNIWFQDGFDKFMQHYSIRERHVLIFTYKGDSNFQVRIFDTSSCEIQYPLHGSISGENAQDPGLGGLEKEGDAHVESSGAELEKSNLKKAGTSLTKPSRSSCPGRAKANDGNHEMVVNCGKEETSTPAGSSKKNANQKMLMSIYTHYRPENASFMVQLRDYNMRMGYIPIPFAKKHLSRDKTYLKVEDLSGKQEWHIGIGWRMTQNKDAYLYNGWRQFLEDNELKIGDVCGFELMNKSTEEGVVLQFSKVHSA